MGTVYGSTVHTYIDMHACACLTGIYDVVLSVSIRRTHTCPAIPAIDAEAPSTSPERTLSETGRKIPCGQSFPPNVAVLGTKTKRVVWFAILDNART